MACDIISVLGQTLGFPVVLCCENRLGQARQIRFSTCGFHGVFNFGMWEFVNVGLAREADSETKLPPRKSFVQHC